MDKQYSQYVFLDVVGYTKNAIEDQFDIVKALQKIVKSAVSDQYFFGFHVCYLPTGDGMCIVLNKEEMEDAHIKLSLKILEKIYNHNQKKDSIPFKVRIGINENLDVVYTDINGRDNYAGRGINFAQRVMDIANGGQITSTQSVYERLADLKEYRNHLKKLTVPLKTDQEVNVYQYVNESLPYLNSELIPKIYSMFKFNQYKKRNR